MTESRRAPLDGIRVLELASVVLGPYAGQILGDLGADVVKVESPEGDSNRNLGPFHTHRDLSSLFLACNRNKRSVVIDLKSERGQSAAMSLVRSADIVLHNYRPDAMQRLRLDYAAVRGINPRAIYCATYGYGRRGPYGGRGALDDSIQAVSGIASLQEKMTGEPRYLPTVVADKTTALFVVQAILAALFHRERTGEGQEIEVPMFESMVSWLMVEHLWGQTFEPPLAGAGYPRLLAEHRRPYRCRDGLYLAVLPYWDSHWVDFCAAAERPELAVDLRFVNMTARLKHIEETYRVTGEIIATRTRSEWLERFADTKVPLMVVNGLDDLVADPHLAACGFWELAQYPGDEWVRMASYPAHFSASPASIRRLAPRLGEHSIEILREAGLTDTEIEQMLVAGETKVPAGESADARAGGRVHGD